MRTFTLGLFFALLVVHLGGCATLHVTPPEALHGVQLDEDGQPIGHIYALNWGWYLFKFIPIVTGSMERPGSVRFPTWFHDEVTVDKVVGKVTETAAELGATKVTDLRTTDRSGWSKASLIFWLNEVEVTANASK